MTNQDAHRRKEGSKMPQRCEVRKPKKIPDTGEFRVAVYCNGKYSENKSYYASDLEDANATYEDMRRFYAGEPCWQRKR